MELFVENIGFVVVVPLLIFFIIGFNFLLSNKLDKSYLFAMSIVTSFISIVFSVIAVLFWVSKNEVVQYVFPWLVTDNLVYSIGLSIDKVSALFLLVFSIVNLFMQILSYRKQFDFDIYPKILLLQNLFAFGMFGLFLSPNLFQSYLFCEVIGVCCYLFLNLNFENRMESKNAIKSFVFGRIGDLSLLFALLVVLYFSVIYNELTGVNSVSYFAMENIVASIYSLLSLPLFLLLCAIFLFVIVMKFMQALVYLTFDIKIRDNVSLIVFFQNILISMIGVYFVFRLYPFFEYAQTALGWALSILFVLFVLLALGNQIFMPLCKIIAWIEKYIVNTVVSLGELAIRFISFLCNRFQAGNFQSYLLYSLMGLVFIFLFILVFYEFLIKV